MAKIDLGYDLKDQTRDGGSDLIDAGDYLCELARVKHMEGKNGKFDQILCTVKVLDAVDADNKKFIGKSFLEGVSLSDKARWRVTQLMDAAFGRAMEGCELDTDDLIEKRLVVRTMVDEYEGKVRTRVDRFMPLSDWSGGAPSDAAKKPAKAASKAASKADDEEVDL